MKLLIHGNTWSTSYIQKVQCTGVLVGLVVHPCPDEKRSLFADDIGIEFVGLDAVVTAHELVNVAGIDGLRLSLCLDVPTQPLDQYGHGLEGCDRDKLL